MSEEKVLTKEIAEQFLADEYSVALGDFNKIQDAAAECLSKYQGTELYLEGLAELSDAAAESLRVSQTQSLRFCPITAVVSDDMCFIRHRSLL